MLILTPKPAWQIVHGHHEQRNLGRRQLGGELIPPTTQAPTTLVLFCSAPARLPSLLPTPTESLAKKALK